jgi:FkbH-like protein
MTDLYENLRWLPSAPGNFADRLKSVTKVSELQQLAKFSLSGNQLRRLATRLAVLVEDDATDSPLAQLRLGLLSNATTSLISPALVGTGLRHGMKLEILESEFNQFAKEALSPEPAFGGRHVDFILIAIDYRGWPLEPSPGIVGAAEENVLGCVRFVSALINGLRAKTGAQLIIQNIAKPAESLFGSIERDLPGTVDWLIDRVNYEIGRLNIPNVFVLDVASIASVVGLSNWHDSALWNIGKVPFAERFSPLYADHVCRILTAARGKTRRCLILDLDNTLWGGIIGDDGIDGIIVGSGSPIGEAHLNVQFVALRLRERGIILAVSSKNDDAIAREPFRTHPDMLLREHHIASFRANYIDKANNIQNIAKELSLGLESMVFLDDNPAERMQVRNALPDVAVPELPKDPSLFARTLLAAGYFEAIAFTEEDRNRAQLYQENTRRTQLVAQSSNMDDYLHALNMTITFSQFDSHGCPRIVQLINKSNQFNLTTKRYSELDIRAMQNRTDLFTRQIRLADTFGDNGMISVIICIKHVESWEIDTWLMSCRVLGRRVEEAVLNEIVTCANLEGVQRLIGIYRPTPRNALVKDHYRKLGFRQVATGDQGSETWELDISDFRLYQPPMELEHLRC